MSFKKIGAFSAATVVLLSSVGMSAMSASAEDVATARGYDNCTALNRDYKHGISDRRMTKRQWIRKGASDKGAYKPNLYDRVHSNLDRDDDHIACES